jgi:hypothetical protein
MGSLYSDIENARDYRWALVAEQKNYRCKRCACHISFEERDVYFQTKLCGWCAYQTAKTKAE